jgi:hypothetical protein
MPRTPPTAPPVFALVSPDGFYRAISFSAHAAWLQFFSYPKDSARAYGMPLEEAYRAYQAIGYRCVECRLVEVVPEPGPDEEAEGDD